MEKISKALCLGEKSGNAKKNKEIAISKKLEKSLQNWSPPPYSVSKDIRFTVISVKKKISIGEGYATFPLLSDNLSRKLRKKFHFLTIFAIQVSLKPTKLGSNASAIVCIRDRRSQKFDESVFGLVESSLNDGPIYFFYNPTHSVCLSDLDVSSSFTIDISTTGLHEDESLLLMYSFKYQVMNSEYNFSTSDEDDADARRKTCLFLTNVAESNRVVSREICWDEVALPEKWMAEFGLLPPAGETVAKPLVGWRETPETHVFEVDIPGLKRRDVMVEVEDGRILQISGERSRELEEGHKWLCEERSSGKFLRRFRLPVDTRIEQMTVEVENGVLTVTVPKEINNM